MTSPEQPVPPDSNAALIALEAGIAAQVLAAYTAWLAAASTAILAPFVLFGLWPDPSAIWGTVPQWNVAVDKIIRDLENIARRGWDNTMAQLGLKIPFDVTDSLVQEQLARTRNLMVHTPDEVYRSILAVIDRGASQDETVAAIRNILDVSGTQNWPARARTVATTETHRAYNFGATAAAQRVDQSDPRVLWKQWDARDDTKTRPAHERADGQWRQVFQPFIVALEALMAPGDPSGSPENVINCRCKQRFSWRNNGR